MIGKIVGDVDDGSNGIMSAWACGPRGILFGIRLGGDLLGNWASLLVVEGLV